VGPAEEGGAGFEPAKTATMKNYASIGVCRICSQGRLVITRDDESGILYIRCEECESEWVSPEQSRSLDAATQGVHGRSTMLDRAEVLEHPWSRFLV
jgi:hypothetical protein